MNQSGPIMAIAVMGPTAAGKSAVAEALAAEYNGQLINMDAYQIYKGFDVGTNKPKNPERYLLMDILEPEVDYGMGQYIQDAHKALETCRQLGKNAIFVGGTGYYTRGLFESYQDFSPAPPPGMRDEVAILWQTLGPEGMKAKIQEIDPTVEVDWQNHHRVCRAYERVLLPPLEKPPLWPSDIQQLKIAINIEPDPLKLRINQRARRMIGPAWIEEIHRILESKLSPSAPAMKAIGYRELVELIQGTMSFEDAVTRIQELTWQYAKRQRTWLRSEPNLHMFDGEDDLKLIMSQVRVLLSQQCRSKDQ